MLLSLTGIFITECQPPITKNSKEVDRMKTKTFILKLLRLISLIILLSTLLVLSIIDNKKALFIKVECQQNIMR